MDKLPWDDEKFDLLDEEATEYAIFLLTPEGNVARWTQGAEELTGYAEEEIVGAHVSVFYPPEDVAGVPEKALETAAEHGQWSGHGWRMHKDGSWSWSRSKIILLTDEEENVGGFAYLLCDLSKHKEQAEALEQSQDRYRHLFETSQEGIAITTPDGTIIDANPASLELLGYSLEEAREMNAAELYVDPSRSKEILDQILAEGAVRNVEVRLRRRDGEEIICRLSSAARYGPKGTVKTIYTVFRDVTERVRLQREVLRVQEEERRRLGRDLHDVVASQLTGVNIMLSSLLSKTEKDEIATRLTEIQDLVLESTNHIRQLSRGLDPTGLSEGSLPVALDRLAANTEGGRFVAEGFNLEEEKAGSPLPQLQEDTASQLYWIAREATTNARKYAEASEVVIRLTREERDLVLSIEDDGIGFDPEGIEREKSLGLRSMRYRANLLGAELTVESSLGQGTRIQCRLPI